MKVNEDSSDPNEERILIIYKRLDVSNEEIKGTDINFSNTSSQKLEKTDSMLNKYLT